jgi:histidinol-phosphatase
MTASAPNRWAELLQAIAEQADEIAMRFFKTADLRIERKSDSSPVTLADRSIEEAARDTVIRLAPDLGVFGEEYGDTAPSAEARLIIDPIDATENFIRGIPIFATLLAIEAKGEVVEALVSAPALRARWRATKGGGAFRGDRRLAVSAVASIRECQAFHAGFPNGSEDVASSGAASLLRCAKRTRGFGDFYQHMLVAEGAGEIAIDPGLRPWDIASLHLIVEEAGGRATTLTGERTIYGGSLITSNGRVHDEALRLLHGEVAG